MRARSIVRKILVVGHQCRGLLLFVLFDPLAGFGVVGELALIENPVDGAYVLASMPRAASVRINLWILMVQSQVACVLFTAALYVPAS